MSNTATSRKPGRYDPTTIEARWQAHWAEQRTFHVSNPGDPGFDASKPKYYILDMFPYPSGSGLHVGHPVGYCATDIIARYKRMRGFNVLHPIGFDAFGLPAEQYAIEHNVHPATTTKKNIDRYREQLKMFGFSYDWDREVATCDASYYKFTQWIFLQLFDSWYDDEVCWTDNHGHQTIGRARPIAELIAALEADEWGVSADGNIVRGSTGSDRRAWSDLSTSQQHSFIDRHRLAYLDEIPVNWCPALGTVLANEEVTNEGLSDRGNHPVFRRPLRQWMLRITNYADRLIQDLGDVDWPEPIKIMQRHWIGKSSGAEVVFPLAAHWSIADGKWICRERGTPAADALSYTTFPNAIRVYTTRPDTLFGATYMVLAPEHELVGRITTADHQDQVQAYVKASCHRSDLDRTADTKEKTGVFTGAYAINPVTGKPIPIWIADYVLMGYGTGAIMAVPGSDTRDFEFAVKFDLPIVCVVKPTTEWIDQRLAEMEPKIDESAKAGFDEIAGAFPDYSDEIAQTRERSANLGAKTMSVLRERVGAERLTEHYVRSPKTWGAAFIEPATAVNSPAKDATLDVPGGTCVLNELSTSEAKVRITAWLEQNGVGRGAVNYKIRDWIFSRQKYWGEPFPVLHDESGRTIRVGDDELPVELPPMDDFKPTAVAHDAEKLPEPPLGRAKEWVNVERNGKKYKRDLNTMPQWAGSCWYYLRFIDPGNDERFSNAEAERYWMPIDLYVGGAEHAVLHLLYARFWHKVLFDLGHVSTREPFGKLYNQGMIQSFAFRDQRGIVVGPDKVEECGDDQYVLKEDGASVTKVVAKMSKALKNVVTPDEIIADWGTDTFRLYEMYMGPLDTSKPWNTRDVPGLHKLCQRIWRLVVDEETNQLSTALTDDAPDADTIRALHQVLKRVTEDLEQLKLNTAIAALFDFVNHMTPCKERPRSVIEPFVLVLSPFAPHLGEELWRRLGHDTTLCFEPWPMFDEALTRHDEVEVAVQINGKLKGRVMVSADADEETIQTAALADEKIVNDLQGKTIRKVIVVKGRLVNVVAV